VRAAILALLAEEPRHGYAIMTELAERSGGLWRPSPGSVYPVLQQLQDEGLVTSTDANGRKVFDLTAEGRRYVEEHAEELREPWQVAEHGPRERVQGLMQGSMALAMAVQQVARLADDEQAAQAVAVLEEARRAMYRILAGDAPGTTDGEPGVEPGGSQA
jgi:DNA-binding PadR family transcriptional regulator